MYDELRVVDDQNVTIHDGVRQWMNNWNKMRQEKDQMSINIGTSSQDGAHKMSSVALQPVTTPLSQTIKVNSVETFVNLDTVQEEPDAKSSLRQSTSMIKQVEDICDIPSNEKTHFTTKPIVSMEKQIEEIGDICSKDTSSPFKSKPIISLEKTQVVTYEDDLLIDEFDKELMDQLLPFNLESTII